ncbi:hypothetical protein M196_gp43 [Halorubrum tailed virus 4]|uniref:Uncharacterized protein n=1 Tax=Halorubrum tailed virus 4 TaxID=1273752 RepID=R4T8D7_9CAUD|nr:hypothetical protein M196_gp43 [Halorubrum tailed virus 4]AGM11135.1 hypothetical protein HRTV4_43 [Halorubrum tailed virus 4]
MQFRRSPGARPADADWHRGRQRARETAFNSSLDLFSETEKVKYELDTARVTGRENPQLYIWNRAIDVFGINGTDVRTLRDQ